MISYMAFIIFGILFGYICALPFEDIYQKVSIVCMFNARFILTSFCAALGMINKQIDKETKDTK